jgi:hypothetical protein
MAKRPLSAYGLNRAMTNYARNAAQTLNPRFQVIKLENIFVVYIFISIFENRVKIFCFLNSICQTVLLETMKAQR